MGDDLDHLAALRGYIEDHETKRRKRAKERPGATRSTMATITHADLGRPATDEEKRFAEIVAWDANLRDINLLGIKTSAMIAWLLARVGTLEVNDRTGTVLVASLASEQRELYERQDERPDRWELWLVFAGILATGVFLGAVVGFMGASIVWSYGS